MTGVVWRTSVDRLRRWGNLRASGATVWFTGLSGSGKSTVAAAVEASLVDAGVPAYLLDGDRRAPYEPPTRADLVLDTAKLTLDGSVGRVLGLLLPEAESPTASSAIP